MKRIVIAVLAICLLALCACGGADKPQNTQAPEGNLRVEPLPSSLDIDNLNDATVSVSFDANSLGTDGGKMTLKIRVYDYELFDTVDVSQLKKGDTIVVNGKEIVVENIDDSNGVAINGGEEMGGVTLIGEDGGTLRQELMDDAKMYYEVGKLTLPVSEDCVLTDSSDLEAPEKTVTAAELEAFIADDTLTFNPQNTQAVIQDGSITAISRVYTP